MSIAPTVIKIAVGLLYAPPQADTCARAAKRALILRARQSLSAAINRDLIRRRYRLGWRS